MSAATSRVWDFEDADVVDTCLMRVRREVGVDQADVLPDIEVMLEDDDDFMEVDDSELVIECPSVLDLPPASVIARHAGILNERRRKTTFRTKKRALAKQSPKRWPVILCGLVATYFGVTAFLASPLGAKPGVQHAVASSRALVHSVVSSL